MLKLAERTLEPLASRVHLYQGHIDDAPQVPFDAATCLLTLHFVTLEERRQIAVEVHRRLKSGAPFVIARLSISQGDGKRALVYRETNFGNRVNAATKQMAGECPKPGS